MLFYVTIETTVAPYRITVACDQQIVEIIMAYSTCTTSITTSKNLVNSFTDEFNEYTVIGDIRTRKF